MFLVMEKLLWDFDKDMGSPFQPGKPVSYYNLVGRNDSAKKILRYAKSASEGDIQHFFLTGERGIGKTSLAKFTLDYIQKYLGSTGIYVSNRGNDTLESFIDSIVGAFLKKLHKNYVKDKVKNLFGNVESLEFKGNKINFKSGKKNSDYMIKNFPYYIQELINDINPDKGVFLVIDDINGLSESKRFVNWYKSFADTVEVNNDLNLKLYVLFAGYRDKFNNFVHFEPSFGRIFHYENLGSLSDFEIREFFINNFNDNDIYCSEEALNNFVYFSQGIPLMMQQIGESAFWVMENNKITEDLSHYSLIHAANEIGNKQLNRFLTIVEEYEYESILMKLGENECCSFIKENFIEYLSEDECNVFDKFLENMIFLDVLKKKKQGEDLVFSFENMLCYTYYLIKSHF